MTTLLDVAKGLRDRLATIAGLNAYDHSAANPEFPAAVVIPPEIDYRLAMRVGALRLDFEVLLLVGAAVHENQKALFEYLDWTGPRSVLRAIDAQPGLGLTGVDAKALTARPLGLEEVNAYQAFGGSIAVVVAITNPTQE